MTAQHRGDPQRGRPAGAEDLVGEVARLAADPTSDDDEILAKLAVLAKHFTVEEVFAVMERYDTPDLLG